MKAIMNSFHNVSSTNYANYTSTSTSAENRDDWNVLLPQKEENYDIETDLNESGKYSVFDIANWFLYKSVLTQKQLQKLCYYAQAWCYALYDYRLEDTDYQAWIHGPVSPVLYERFKSFGYRGIKLKGNTENKIEKKDEELLEDVWATYGNKTGNALEALSHRELPWKRARKGYSENERCNVVISPESMKEYYRSIAEE